MQGLCWVINNYTTCIECVFGYHAAAGRGGPRHSEGAGEISRAQQIESETER